MFVFTNIFLLKKVQKNQQFGAFGRNFDHFMLTAGVRVAPFLQFADSILKKKYLELRFQRNKCVKQYFFYH